MDLKLFQKLQLVSTVTVDNGDGRNKITQTYEAVSYKQILPPEVLAIDEQIVQLQSQRADILKIK